MTDPIPLFSAHLEACQRGVEEALRATGWDGLVLDSGWQSFYHADDQPVPFRPTPHFARWTPLNGPGHTLVIRPGLPPRLIYFAPEDFWYEVPRLDHPFWADAFDVATVATQKAVAAEVGPTDRLTYIGSDIAAAHRLGFSGPAINDPVLVARLDWQRSYKTEYEVACIQQATVSAAAAHRAARAAFAAGASELDIHYAYVQALRATDNQLPFESIVALDEKGAVLHYIYKRTGVQGRVLLLDSGASHLGYASDITRTWTTPDADPTFRAMRDEFDQLQQKLAGTLEPGMSFTAVHQLAHERIADFLHQFEILRIGGRDAVERGLTLPFFPHGLGHFLGIQVHDVAGRQREPAGGVILPPLQFPSLRTTRVLEPGQVITIEPGVYFIEMLLAPEREGPNSQWFNWPLIDRLKTHGGIRIEDNVLITAQGAQNLTRAQLPE